MDYPGLVPVLASAKRGEGIPDKREPNKSPLCARMPAIGIFGTHPKNGVMAGAE